VFISQQLYRHIGVLNLPEVTTQPYPTKTRTSDLPLGNTEECLTSRCGSGLGLAAKRCLLVHFVLKSAFDENNFDEKILAHVHEINITKLPVIQCKTSTAHYGMSIMTIIQKITSSTTD